MAYPADLADLRPYAARCDLVGNDDDCRRFVADLSPDSLRQFVDLYVELVDRGAKPRLDDWIENAGVSRDASEAMRLLTLLDYLARHDYIPEPQANTRFIEWDNRDFDDHGNEW